ncbi:MAG TPA: hypothetical protein VGK63_07405 [Candidatus Limnocylindrales bacterium]
MRTARAGLLVVLVGLSLAFATFSGLSNLMPTVAGGGQDLPPIVVAPAALFIWVTPILGGMLALRRPGNPIGWLFVLMTLGWSAGFASDDLARHTATTTLVAAVVTVGQQIGAVGYVSLFLLLMLFPDGALPSRRWRALPTIALAGAGAGILAGLLRSGSPIDPPVKGLDNPFAVPALAPVVSLLDTLSPLAFLVGAIGALVLLARRMRRSRGIERQQLKWFVSAAALTITMFIAVIVVDVVAPEAPLASELWSLPVASVVLLPIAAAVAVLRYRLYEIDRIISRTISYAIVTALLAAAYLVAFFALEGVLAPVTGNGGPVAVAASTLVVFALFAPLRRRISTIVDRRFDRSRYDAERTVSGLVERLRNETDLGQLGADVEGAVRTALAPAVVALWTRTK